MKSLVISDNHVKPELAQNIIDNEPHDQVIFLGDFFDDFGDTPEDNHKTALWLKQKLREDNVTAILGNHDASYYDPSRYVCSGYTRAKLFAIKDVLDQNDWDKFKLHAWVDGWLLTHAGLDARLFEEDEPTKEQIDEFCEDGLKSLRDKDSKMPHPALAAGIDRGGYNLVGGITWCDFDVLRPPTGFNQLCGHTQGHEVREKHIHPWFRAVCIDTRMKDYAVIENGALKVKSVADLDRKIALNELAAHDQ